MKNKINSFIKELEDMGVKTSKKDNSTNRDNKSLFSNVLYWLNSPRTIVYLLMFIIVLLIPIPLAYYHILDLAQTGAVYLVLVTVYTLLAQRFFDKILEEPKNNINIINKTDNNKERILRGFENELKNNFLTILLLVGLSSGSSSFEGSWREAEKFAAKLTYFYSDEFIQHSLYRDYKEDEERIIIDVLSKLKQLPEKVRGSLNDYMRNGGDKNAHSYPNQRLSREFRNELIDIMHELESVLLIINKENAEFIKNQKTSHSINL